jgi:cephalosporin-C deacetylase-like acetyl esterase
MDKIIIIGTNEPKDELKEFIDEHFPKEKESILITNCMGGIITNTQKTKSQVKVIVLLGNICNGSVFAAITQIKEKKQNAKIYEYSNTPVEDRTQKFSGTIPQSREALLEFLNNITNN